MTSILSKMKVLCDIYPLEFFYVLLGNPSFWKLHVVYESRPRSIIITLGRQLYRIPEVAPPTIIFVISPKEFSKFISQTGKFVFFVIQSHSKKKVVTTYMDGIMEEYRDIFSSPTMILMHCQVKNPIDITLISPMPNGTIYHHSLMENDEINHHIQELLQKGHIIPISYPCEILILLV
jgi:hypothetical protein